MGFERNSCGEFVDWMNFDVHTITDERGNEKQVIYIQREVNSIGEVVMTYIEVPDDCNELYAHKAERQRRWPAATPATKIIN